MRKVDTVDDQHFIFGTLLILANKIDTVLSRELKDFDITSKQWFLSLVIDNLFDEDPTISEVAKEMGSSHQNVKQVALKLENKGMLRLEKDAKDGRSTRLKFTEKSSEVWSKTQIKGEGFTQGLFRGISEDELAGAKIALGKMLFNLNQMEDGKVE